MRSLDDITPDYSFYKETYRGKRLEHDAFDEALIDSVAEVDSRIREGADLDADTTERAKMAVCSICEAVADASTRIRSLSVGKTSETYDAPPYSMSAAATVRRYLGTSGVLKGGQWV